MTEQDDIAEKLMESSDPTRKQLRFVALLAKKLGVSTDELVVVGGSATAIFTDGRYTSDDIDIVLTGHSDQRDGILSRWGFKKQGRQWFNENLGIFIDFVKPPYTFDKSRTQVILTVDGPVRIASIEDLLVKWMLSSKFWNVPKDMEYARLLALSNRDRIDWRYVERLSMSEDVGDYLEALLKSIRTESHRDASPSRRKSERKTSSSPTHSAKSKRQRKLQKGL